MDLLQKVNPTLYSHLLANIQNEKLNQLKDRMDTALKIVNKWSFIILNRKLFILTSSIFGMMGGSSLLALRFCLLRNLISLTVHTSTHSRGSICLVTFSSRRIQYKLISWTAWQKGISAFWKSGQVSHMTWPALRHK